MFDLDLVIIGSGPAGLTAAQYGARANLKVLVIEQLTIGGQALLIDVLENYPGNVGQINAAGVEISGPKSGYDFIVDLHRQAESFGASFLTGNVIAIKKDDDRFIISMIDGSKHSACAVIIATGAKPRLLGIPGENEFTGRGVSYCASCDGNFFKGKKIFVVGGGDAACDEARYLSRLTKHVVLVHRRGSFRAQKALAARTLENENIQTRFNTVIKEIKGDKKVSSVVLENTLDGNSYEDEADAVFIFAGTSPQSGLVSPDNTNTVNAALDENGYIITGKDMATNVPGLYAAGDVRSGAFRQVVTAAADGAIAAHNAAKYIDETGCRD